MPSHLLIDESPVQLLPSLAKAVGLNEAIILQQLHYWLRHKQADPETYAGNFKEGRWWNYNSVVEWQKQFPWWSTDTVRRALTGLVERKILFAKKLSEDKFDKTLWYSIDYDVLNGLIPEPGPENTQESAIATSQNRLSQAAIIGYRSEPQSYSESETTCIRLHSENPPLTSLRDTPPMGGGVNFDQNAGFTEFWAACPRKQGKDGAERKYKQKITTKAKHDELMLGLARSKASSQWLAEKGKFIPYPATYLNAGGYKDELDTPHGPPDKTASASPKPRQYVRGSDIAAGTQGTGWFSLDPVIPSQTPLLTPSEARQAFLAKYRQ